MISQLDASWLLYSLSYCRSTMTAKEVFLQVGIGQIQVLPESQLPRLQDMASAQLQELLLHHNRGGGMTPLPRHDDDHCLQLRIAV